MRTAIDKRFVLALSRPLGIIKTPLAPAADALRTGPDRLLKQIRAYKRAGIIRRYGAVLAHRRVGLRCNALVAWRVAPRRIRAAGQLLARHPSVSHCYLRKTAPRWQYNLYTMVHAGSRCSCMRAIRALSRAAGADGYIILETVKELKKTKAVIW